MIATYVREDYISDDKKYTLLDEIVYRSPRYNKTITVPKGYRSDGATGAMDIHSNAWWVHDKLCDTGKWDDDTECTDWQASSVLSDVLKSEKRYFRAFYWKYSTFAYQLVS